MACIDKFYRQLFLYPGLTLTSPPASRVAAYFSVKVKEHEMAPELFFSSELPCLILTVLKRKTTIPYTGVPVRKNSHQNGSVNG
ncbi:MAG: hypothetical protein ACXWTH_03110 [Methylosarcina sp.]